MKRNIELGNAIDERLSAALERANYQLTLNNQKQHARQKLDADLIYATNGGIFKVGPELISFISTLISMEHEDGVILDMNKNPIDVPDLKNFLQDIVAHYYEAMNDFMLEFKKIQKARKTDQLVS